MQLLVEHNTFNRMHKLQVFERVLLKV